MLLTGMLLPVPPYSIAAYIIMQFCHFRGMPSFVFQVLYFYLPLCSRHTNCQAGSVPVPAAALPAPATATSLGVARPSSLPALAAASFQRLWCLPLPHPLGQRAHPCRRQRPASSAAGTGQLPAPPVPATATSGGGSVGNYPTRSLDCARSSDDNSDTRPDHQVLDRGAMPPQTTADMLSPVHAQSCSHVVPLS